MKMYVLAVLMLAAFNASATNNNPPNECGNHGNNCQTDPGGSTNNEANSNATGGAGGSGTGIGKGGDGGNAAAFGGAGGDATAGVIGSGNSSAKGGDASQGQLQGQQQGQQMGQGQSSTNVSGSKSIAQMASENTNRVNASSQNANNSQASGNTTATTVNVGGDSTLVERNAPPVFLGAITPTSCGGSFNAGGSSRDGAGGFGFSWVGTECAIRQLGDRYQQMGQVDTACELYSSTKAFKKAAKRNPKLRSLDCSIKPEQADAVVPVAPELAPRIPRG